MDETGAKITALDPLTDGASDDLLAIVDVSDNNVEEGAMSADGTDKKITLENLAHSLLDWIYPVGTIYETTSTDLDTTTKMANHFGGTWEAYGSGKVLVAKSTDTQFDTIGETGGAKTHQHRQSGMGRTSSGASGGEQVTAWNEDCYGVSSSSVSYANYGTISIGGVGSSKTVYPWLTEEVSSLQPYIVVYRYRRIA